MFSVYIIHRKYRNKYLILCEIKLDYNMYTRHTIPRKQAVEFSQYLKSN